MIHSLYTTQRARRAKNISTYKIQRGIEQPKQDRKERSSNRKEEAEKQRDTALNIKSDKQTFGLQSVG